MPEDLTGPGFLPPSDAQMIAYLEEEVRYRISLVEKAAAEERSRIRLEMLAALNARHAEWLFVSSVRVLIDRVCPE